MKRIFIRFAMTSACTESFNFAINICEKLGRVKTDQIHDKKINFVSTPGGDGSIVLAWLPQRKKGCLHVAMGAFALSRDSTMAPVHLMGGGKVLILLKRILQVFFFFLPCFLSFFPLKFSPSFAPPQKNPTD